jgi:hypothetical protein
VASIIVPGGGAIKVFKLGSKQAAKQAAKEVFRKEAGDLPRRVIRDRTTNRIKGVGVEGGKATYRPKGGGNYSVEPKTGPGRDTLHFRP